MLRSVAERDDFVSAILGELASVTGEVRAVETLEARPRLTAATKPDLKNCFCTEDDLESV
jgi:hypothetical protein